MTRVRPHVSGSKGNTFDYHLLKCVGHLTAVVTKKKCTRQAPLRAHLQGASLCTRSSVCAAALNELIFAGIAQLHRHWRQLSETGTHTHLLITSRHSQHHTHTTKALLRNRLRIQTHMSTARLLSDTGDVKWHQKVVREHSRQ